MSKHGSAAHERLLNRIRWDCARSFWQEHPDVEFGLACDERVMVRCVGRESGLGRRREGGRIPDLVFLAGKDPAGATGPGRVLVVEIGRCDFGKWPEYNLLHVNFSGAVTYVRRREDRVMQLFAETVRGHFADA